MAKRKTAKRKPAPRVLKRSKTQTGKTNLKADRKRKALAPGLRLSKNKKKYTETRRNRSDKNRKKKL